MPESPQDSDAEPARSAPARDLGAVWDLLDALPPAAAAAEMTATTVELVAARVDGAGGPAVRSSGIRRWLGPAAVVAAALTAGFVTGRATAPDPVLRNLPLLEHFQLLREAGSVGFLDALARQMTAGEGLQSRWFRLPRDPQASRSEARDFDARIDRLRAELAAGDSATSLARRRERLEQLSAAELAELERSAEAFESLTQLARNDLEAVARVLADPQQTRLQEAARSWHVIVSSTSPLVRQGVVDMSPQLRLEWLERPAGMEWRGGFPGRPRDEDRGGGDRRPGPPRPWPEPPGGPPPRGPFRPDGAGPPAVPPGTPAPPR